MESNRNNYRGRANRSSRGINDPFAIMDRDGHDPFSLMTQSFGQMDKLMNDFFKPFSDIHGQMNGMLRRMENEPLNENGTFFKSFSSQSSTWQNANSQPIIQKKAMTETRLPGQVSEKQQMEYDSRTGAERVEISRRIGDKGRQVIKEKKGSNHDEITKEYFHGMTEADAARFDEDWDRVNQGIPRLGGRMGNPRNHRLASPYNRAMLPDRQRKQASDLGNHLTSSRMQNTSRSTKRASSRISNLSSQELLDKIHGSDKKRPNSRSNRTSSRSNIQTARSSNSDRSKFSVGSNRSGVTTNKSKHDHFRADID